MLKPSLDLLDRLAKLSSNFVVIHVRSHIVILINTNLFKRNVFTFLVDGNLHL